MIWPGTGDPYKRKKAIKFLLISAAIGGIAVLLTTVGVNPMIAKQAHNACIDDMDTDWKISFTFEMIMDGQKAEVQPNIGIMKNVKEQYTHFLMMVQFMQNGQKTPILN